MKTAALMPEPEERFNVLMTSDNRLLLMPDIDEDFNTSNIDEFLDFVQKKYGKGVR